MNKFTRNMKSSLSADRAPQVKRSPWVGPFLLVTFAIALMLFCSVSLNVRFRSDTEALNRQSAHLDNEISVERLSLENLRTRKETLCSWKNISGNIKKFNLGLQPQQPGQITYVRRYRGDGVPVPGTKMAENGGGGVVVYNGSTPSVK